MSNTNLLSPQYTIPVIINIIGMCLIFNIPEFGKTYRIIVGVSVPIASYIGGIIAAEIINRKK